MHGLGRETLAIIGATIALAALILTGTPGVRGEFQTVARTDREPLCSRTSPRPAGAWRRG